MPFYALMLMAVAIGAWFGGRKRRQQRAAEARREIETTLTTGLPSPETALGRKAQEVAEADRTKLQTPPPIHGSARWATTADLTAMIPPAPPAQGSRELMFGTLVEGDNDTGLPLVARYPGHLLTVAGSGQGKSATQLVGNLMTYGGSAIILDPKGELFDLTADARRAFGPVYRLAPYARPGDPPSDRYNPLDEVDHPVELGARSRRLAEMLIVREGDRGAASAAFWENQAINLLTALIMATIEFAAKTQRPDTRTLAEVMRLASLPILGSQPRKPAIREYIEDQLLLMAQSSTNPFVRQQGMAFMGLDPKTLGGFLAEINANLAFFSGHPGFAATTAASDFKLADLAHAPATVYLTIPFKEMPSSFRFLRAMVGLAFAALEEQREATEASVLFVLDEFAALRRMEFMKDAVAQMRSSGAWLWFLVQDLAQLDTEYGDAANVFLSQTDHQVYFGATLDQRTKTYLSTALGVTTFAYRDASVSWQHSIGTSDGVSESPTQVGGVNLGRSVGQSVNIQSPVQLAPKPLLTPAEVGMALSARMPGQSHSTSAIILSKQAGGFPILARRQHWRTQDLIAVPSAIPFETGDFRDVAIIKRPQAVS